MRYIASFLVCLAFAYTVDAHPVPDIPVRGVFSSNGTAMIVIEVDPRCFSKDPLNTPYLKKRELDAMNKASRDELFGKVRRLIKETIKLELVSPAELKPKFTFRFSERPDADPDSDTGVPIVVEAVWKFDLPSDEATYRLIAGKKGRFAVQFLNKIDGMGQKRNVLFPGEKSYALTLPKP